MNSDSCNNSQLHLAAHRGGSYDAPENTRAAIQLAIDRGSDMVEFDVMRSKDGELFLFHDQDLRRLCNQPGNFEDLAASEIKKLDVGSWFDKGDFKGESPLTLSEAVRLCLGAGATPMIERKTGTPVEYARVLTEIQAVEKVIVLAFDWEFLIALKALLPTLEICTLGLEALEDRKQDLQDPKLPNRWVGWKNEDTNSADIDWLKQHSYRIAIWTVNDPDRAKQLINWGVDRVITDRPLYMGQTIHSME